MSELAEDRSKLKMEAHWHQALISAASTHPPFVPSSKTVRVEAELSLGPAAGSRGSFALAPRRVR